MNGMMGSAACRAEAVIGAIVPTSNTPSAEAANRLIFFSSAVKVRAA
jgi:hypothetical protein